MHGFTHHKNIIEFFAIFAQLSVKKSPHRYVGIEDIFVQLSHREDNSVEHRAAENDGHAVKRELLVEFVRWERE